MTVALAGQVGIAREGTLVETTGLGRLGRLAFAYLVTHRGRTVPRDELAEVLWGDDLPRTWDTSLRVVVSKLRTWLEEAGLGRNDVTSSFGTYQLHLPAGTTVDIEEAASAATAAEAALAAGDAVTARALATDAAETAAREFLPGATSPWAERQQAGLRDLLVAALETLADACLAAGDASAALVAAEEAVILEPLRESAHLRAMAAHAGAGNRADALRAYERVRRTLADELGVSPSRPIEAAYLALLTDDAEGAAPRPAAAPSVLAAARRLPAPLSSFVGRAGEVAEVERLVGANRLVTVLGTGGMGKTRLALEVARRREGPAVWVELAEMGTPDEVPAGFLAALGVPEEPGRAATDTITAHLASLADASHADASQTDLLLAVDNCEHVVGAAAALVQAVLQACPGVRVLATSRTALRIPGEVAWDLAPLPADDAARLFVDRAGPHLGDVDASGPPTPALEAICRRLDGLPLAIELAAARADVLSVDQIAARLDDRFKLLTGGARTASPRQQTLRGALDWTYEALAPLEQALFQRLSVFAGSFTLDAAEAVASDPLADGSVPDSAADGDLVDRIATLAGTSLLGVQRAGETVRYRLLETVRAYAAEKLDTSAGIAARARLRLLAWAARTAEEAERHLDGPDQAAWLDRLAADHPNLRAALAIDPRHGDALRLAAALGRFWEVRGHFQEGRDWLRTVLDDTEGAPPLLLARAQNAAALLAQRQGDYAAARSRLEASLALRRTAGDALGAAIALHGLGNLAALQRDLTAARELYEQSLALGRDYGDDALVAAALDNLGWVAHTAADFASARGYYEEALVTRRRLGDDHGIAVVLGQVGDLAYQRGDYDTAGTRHRESLALRTRLDDRAGRADSLATLGHLALHDGDAGPARRHFEESLALRRELGDRSGVPSALTNLADLALVVGAVDEARAHLDEAVSIAGSSRDGAALAHVLVHLGRVERVAGQPGAARARYGAARQVAGGFGSDAVGAEWLEGVGATLAAAGELDRGARLLASATRLRESVGVPVPVHERAAHEADVAAVREAMGAKAFAKAWKAGLDVPVEQALAEAAAAIEA